MKNLLLTERSSFIAEKIPKQYRKIILNSIIAKSVENRLLGEELLLYLKEEDVLQIMDELNIKTSIKKKQQIRIQKKPYNQHIKKEDTNDISSKFEGFDD